MCNCGSPKFALPSGDPCHPPEQPIPLTRGDTLVYTTQLFTLANRALPQDLTGCKVWFTVKKYASDPDVRAVFQGDTATSGVTANVPLQAGYVTATMPAQSTVGFPDQPVLLIWDFQVKLPSGAVNTLKTGQILLSPDVTRATT